MSFLVPANFRQIPPVWEVSQPFQIDATGQVAYDQDPVAWARNHILAILLTIPGERVMRPTYGVGMFHMVFENDNSIVEQQITTTIQASVAAWEPQITINQCVFLQQPDYSGVMELQIAFSVGETQTVHALTLTLGGTGIEVTA